MSWRKHNLQMNTCSKEEQQVKENKNKLFENFYNQNARTFISAMQLSM